jgi:hypothetical protein
MRVAVPPPPASPARAPARAGAGRVAVAALTAACLLAACKASPRADRDEEPGAPPAHPLSEPGGGGVTAPVDPTLSAEPIVMPRPGRGPSKDPEESRSRRRVAEDEAFYREKFDLAQAAAQGGDDETALALVTAALALGPPPGWEERLKALRSTVKARHLELDVVRADARGVRDYVVFGQDVDFVVRVRNLGSRDLVVRPPAGPGPDEVSGSVLALSISRRDRDIYAAELVRSWTQTVALVVAGQPALVVPPEGSHEVQVRIPAAEAGPALSGLRVLEVTGDLRLTGASVGIAEPISRIPIRAGRVVGLPGNYEPVAAEPLVSLRKALGAAAPVHVLVAAEFLPASDRAAAAQALADALAAGDEALGPTIRATLALLRERAGDAGAVALAEPFVRRMRTHPAREADLAHGLTTLTGVSLPPDVRLWEDWWRRNAR